MSIYFTGLEIRSIIYDHSNNKPLCDLIKFARKHKLVGVGHRFGNVSVLATIPGNFYPKKLKRTLNADRLKFNGWLAPIDMK